jgi:hypothetical protein
MGPISIELPRPQARNEDMPIVVGSIACRLEMDYALWANVIGIVEQQQLDLAGITRVQAEVYASIGNRGS